MLKIVHHATKTEFQLYFPEKSKKSFAWLIIICQIRPLFWQINIFSDITRVFKLHTEKASLIVTTVYSRIWCCRHRGESLPLCCKYRPKNVLFRINIDIHGETKWVLSYRRSLRNIWNGLQSWNISPFLNITFWMILEAFECPIVKKGQLQSYLILSSKGVFKNRNAFFIGMVQL